MENHGDLSSRTFFVNDVLIAVAPQTSALYFLSHLVKNEKRSYVKQTSAVIATNNDSYAEHFMADELII